VFFWENKPSQIKINQHQPSEKNTISNTSITSITPSISNITPSPTPHQSPSPTPASHQSHHLQHHINHTISSTTSHHTMSQSKAFRIVRPTNKNPTKTSPEVRQEGANSVKQEGATTLPSLIKQEGVVSNPSSAKQEADAEAQPNFDPSSHTDENGVVDRNKHPSGCLPRIK
jgi:hypothetical protein